MRQRFSPRLHAGRARFVRFCIVGASSTAIDLGLLALLTQAAGWHPLAASPVSYGVGVTNGWFWNRHWTFPKARRGKAGGQYGRFVLVNLVGVLIDQAVVAGALVWGPRLGLSSGWEPYAGKLASIPLAVAWNFAANTRWTFAERPLSPTLIYQERPHDVDDPSQAWATAHAGNTAFYGAIGADKAFFARRAENPMVAAVVVLGQAQRRPLKILEVGTGSGADSICLALQGHEVTSVDVSEHLLINAQKLAETAATLFPERELRLTFAPGNILDLGEHAGRYDLVYSFGVTTIWRNRNKRLDALRNLRAALRVAAPGWLVLGTTNTLHPVFKIIPVKSLVADLADQNLKIFEGEINDADLQVIQRGALGLSDHYEQYVTAAWVRTPLRIANLLVESLPTSLKLLLAPHVFVVAQKGPDNANQEGLQSRVLQCGRERS